MSLDEQSQRAWHRMPGVAALLSRLAMPLAASLDWTPAWARVTPHADWRDALDEDSRCRLLAALALDADFDISLHGHDAHDAPGHWRCVGWWDAPHGAHGCHIVDVTRAERQRQRSNTVSECIHLLFEQLPVRVAYFSPPPRVICLFANEGFARAMGLDRHSIIGRSSSDILKADDRKALQQLLAGYEAGRQRITFLHGRVEPDGTTSHHEVSLASDQDGTGRPHGTFVAMADVTERHRTEVSLRASQERLFRFMEVSAEGVFFHRDGQVTDANPAACRMLSMTHEELVGRPVLSLSAEPWRARSHVAIDSGADAYLETVMLDGHDRPVSVELIGRTMSRQNERLRMTVMRDIRSRRDAQTRIHALIEDLRSQKDRAESADRAKSVFLAAASHDLRQPIHAMGLFLSALRAMAQAPRVPPSDLADICRRMQSSLDGLGQLLNMLLDVSRLDANAVQVQTAPTPLAQLFDEIGQEFYDLAHEKGLRLHVAYSSAWVSTDATVLRRILSNLMANAVRYTPHGRVLLGARRRPDHIEIQVCDSGIGIAPEQLEAIFEEFYQIGQARARRGESHGLGLGLSIVKRSAKLIDAELLVRSTPGRGSVFSIKLPPCEPPPAGPERASSAEQTPPAQQRSVLVIDDDAQVLLGMQQLLQVWGHRVWCADSADAAVVLAIEHASEIDLLLSDYRLGGNTTAVQAIAAVHACLGRPVPTFILTGDTSPQRIQEASELGFPLLHKPVDTPSLQRALRH